MRITRDKHWQFLEDELKATTEEFQVKFEASARRLLDEKGEMFVAIFESFNKNGSMVMKFPNTRPIPRKGAHQMCMLLPKELRNHAQWGDKTYKDLYAARFKGTDCVCLYHGKSDDERFTLVGFRGVDVEFQKEIEGAAGVILVFAPQFPPLEYAANLQKVVRDEKSKAVASILDAEYKPRAWKPRLIQEEDAVRVVLSQMALTPTTILQGPPGTGKTYAIARICAELCGSGKSVLVTALTNQALIEIAEKPALQSLLAEGKISKVHLSTDEAKRVKGLRLARTGDPVKGELILATYYMSSGYAASASEDGLFDSVIMDEASQAVTAMFAAASKLGKSNLWVGDIKQLAPVVLLNPDRVKDSGYDDLIDGLRLISCNREFPVMQLTKTYRLGRRATKFTGMFYAGTLVSAESRDTYETVGLEGVADQAGGPVVMYVDMPIGDATPAVAIENVIGLVKSIIGASAKKSIAVLAHRVKTVVALQKAKARALGDKGDVLIDTVARIQGLTTDVVIFLVPNTGYHHGLERRLFNVATSRAKEHTIIVVDKSVLRHKELDAIVLNYLRDAGSGVTSECVTSSPVPICDDVVEGGEFSFASEVVAATEKRLSVSEVQALIDDIQIALGTWLKHYLPIVHPKDMWKCGVIQKLTELQYQSARADGARTLDDLDLTALLSVFIGNFRDLRNVSHIRQEMQTMAFHIKEVRHDYAHKKTKAIVHADYATLQYHIYTLIRFRDGLGEVPEVKKASPTTVVTKNGLTISVS